MLELRSSSIAKNFVRTLQARLNYYVAPIEGRSALNPELRLRLARGYPH
jgi:hypothetical protein